MAKKRFSTTKISVLIFLILIFGVEKREEKKCFNDDIVEECDVSRCDM